MAIKETLIQKMRKDGTLGEIIVQEEVPDEGSAVDLKALDEARSVAEGDADAAELMELLGVGKAEAIRRAVRFTLEQKKAEGK